MSGFFGALLSGGGMLTQLLGTTEGATAGGLPVMLRQLVGSGQSGTTGGLQSLVAQFESAGMGEHIRSWIGTSENLPITAEQVTQAIPADHLDEWAGKFGIPRDKISALLAEILPHAVDHVTPGGTLPAPGDALPDMPSLQKRLMSI